MQILSLEMTAMVGAGNRYTWEVAGPVLEGLIGFAIVSACFFDFQGIGVKEVVGVLGGLIIVDAVVNTVVMAEKNTK